MPDNVRTFRVYDEAHPRRQGTCRAYSSHFDIDWDDNVKDRGILDLANIGVSKVPEHSTDRKPQRFA